MTRTKIFLCIITLILTSCFDVFEKTYWKEGKYFIQTDPGDPSCKVLYRDIQNAGIGRVECISQINSNDSFIVAKSANDKYWVLDKNKDSDYLNAEDIVEGPLTLDQYKKRKLELNIDKLELKNF